MARHYLDRYDSPRWMMDCLFEFLSFPGLKLEPCVGSGRWIGDRHGWITNDIDPNAEANYHFDATTNAAWDMWDDLGINHVITNPPFSKADAILRQALSRGYEVAFVLRANWAEPTESRYDLLKKYPYTAQIIMPRYCFTQSRGRWQTDSCTCHWYIWSDRVPSNLAIFSMNDINQFSHYTRHPIG